MASYVSDCQNVYVDEIGDSGVTPYYTTYSTPDDAREHCLANNDYYVNSFSDYAIYKQCSSASSGDNDGAGYVSDGINVWVQGTADQNQEEGDGGTCDPDCLSSAQACKQGQTWPLLLNNIYGTDYKIYTEENFKLFEKPVLNIALVIVILMIIAALIYYFVMRKK